MNLCKWSAALALCCASALIFAAGCGELPNSADAGGGETAAETGREAEPVREAMPLDLRVVCVGDVMTHMSQVNAAYDAASDSYDFTGNYEYVRDFIEGADLALCNVETTFAGKPYTGYPGFSGPDELAFDLKTVGFDVAMTANNHMYDKGSKGLHRTLEICRAAGLETTGSRQDESEPRYALTRVEARAEDGSRESVPVAVISYTYESPKGSSPTGVALNGIPVSAADIANINSFAYETPDVTIAEISEVCREAKDAGAELCLLYLHWGNEYQLSANRVQRELAERIVSEIPAVDAIFASHPHNLQEMGKLEKTTSEVRLLGRGGAIAMPPKSGADFVPLYYSLGNFVSNQRAETLGNDKSDTEIGAIAAVDFRLRGGTHEIIGVSMDVLPTWVDRYNAGGLKYSIIPLDGNLEANPALAVSGHLSRAKRAEERAYELLGADR